MIKKQDLIGYCGLYCGDCPGYTQTVAHLARDLRKEPNRHQFGQIADTLVKVPVFKEFQHCDKRYNLLGTMMKLRRKKLCRGHCPPFVVAVINPHPLRLGSRPTD